MKRWSQLLTIALAVVFAFVFAVQNSREFVDVRLGPISFRAITLPVVVFGAILLGMIVVFVIGLRADLQTRALLRRYREKLDHRD